jgi:acyl-CoA synthetase (AMP-forming)/AMP-acid ligase II
VVIVGIRRVGVGACRPYNEQIVRLSNWLDRLALAKPDLCFAIQGMRRISYQQAAAESDRLAKALLGAGLRTGDRFAVLAKNSIEYALLYFAASKADLTLVPLNYRLAPPEWCFILNDAGASMLLAGQEYLAPVDAIRNDLRTVDKYVCIDSEGPGWNGLGSLSPSQSVDGVRCEGANPDFVQMYTSGTTGRPKGVVLTHRSLISTAVACTRVFGGEPAERYLLVVPMFHIFGVAVTLNIPLVEGTLFIMQEFEPAAVIRILRDEKIAVAALVPSMIQFCLNHPDAAAGEYAALRCLIYGASAISEATLRRAMDVFRCGFLQAYGMTEIAPLSALLPEDHERALVGKPALLGSAGRSVHGIELQIVDFHDQTVAPGIVGEIVARGASMMSCYWNRPEATVEALRGGWMHTGDMGYMDSEGYVYIQDRLKDMIVSGAENIYPREVEEILAAMPAVAGVAVIGVPDSRWGETVKAIVVLREGVHATEQEVIDFCRGRLAGFKLPRSVDFVDRLPCTATGKVLKRELREPYWRGITRRVAGS